MPKDRRWIRQRVKDSFYQRAKKTGYRSRAAFKLIQLNKNFKIFRSGQIVLDLCCAPGGWLQVALEEIGPEGVVIGVDNRRISKIENAIFIQSDITNQDLISQIQTAAPNGVDVIIADCAPKISGISELDNARQLFLAETSFKIAKSILKVKGTFVTKLFQGREAQKFLEMVKTHFLMVKVVKPSASMKRSREEFLIGKGFKNR